MKTEGIGSMGIKANFTIVDFWFRLTRDKIVQPIDV